MVLALLAIRQFFMSTFLSCYMTAWTQYQGTERRGFNLLSTRWLSFHENNHQMLLTVPFLSFSFFLQFFISRHFFKSIFLIHVFDIRVPSELPLVSQSPHKVTSNCWMNLANPEYGPLCRRNVYSAKSLKLFYKLHYIYVIYFYLIHNKMYIKNYNDTISKCLHIKLFERQLLQL